MYVCDFVAVLFHPFLLILFRFSVPFSVGLAALAKWLAGCLLVRSVIYRNYRILTMCKCTREIIWMCMRASIESHQMQWDYQQVKHLTNYRTFNTMHVCPTFSFFPIATQHWYREQIRKIFAIISTTTNLFLHNLIFTERNFKINTMVSLTHTHTLDIFINRYYLFMRDWKK